MVSFIIEVYLLKLRMGYPGLVHKPNLSLTFLNSPADFTLTFNIRAWSKPVKTDA